MGIIIAIFVVMVIANSFPKNEIISDEEAKKQLINEKRN